MPDEQPNNQPMYTVKDQTDTDHNQNGTAGEPARRASRRLRPSPAYTAGRRASLARRRGRVEQPRRRGQLLLPILAVVALLAMILAVVGDRVLGSAATPAATATAAPASTPAPTNTPISMPPPPTTKSGVAAEVNGEVVQMDLFATMVRVDANSMQRGSTDPSTGQQTPPVDLTKPDGLKQFHQQERADLNQLIQTAAAVAYAKKHNLVATQTQVQAALNNLYSQAGDKATFLKEVESEGYSEATVNKIVADTTTVQNVFKVMGKQAPNDGKTVRQILVDTKNKTLADKLAKELQADHGSNFAALAKKYSTDTQSAAQGGSLGVVTKGAMDQSLDKAIFSLKYGQISDPVKAQDGWHIIEVLGPGQSQTSQTNYFTSWLTKQQATATIYVKIPNP